MVSDNKLVSVLMCVYNEPSYMLKEAIESILNQTYSSFEFVIICDNPSNERVIDIVSQYQIKDKRIVFKINEHNIGLTRSLNVGLSICQGKYVVRMDADDISLPIRIEKELDYMEENPDVAACSSYIYYIDSQGHSVGKRRTITNRKKLAVQGIFSTPLIHPASIIRRIVNKKYIFYDESLRYAQDFGLWSSLPIGSVSNIPDYLLKYRITDNQITSKNREQQVSCERMVQYNNLKRQGVSLDDNVIKTYNFLINGKDDSSISTESIETLIGEIMKRYAGLVDRKCLYRYLINRYANCLCRRDYSLFKALKVILKLSSTMGVYSFKPCFFVIYTKFAK